MHKLLSCLITAGLALTVVTATHAADLAEQTFQEYVDASGNIRLPQGFRLSWTHLGSWVVTDPKAPGHGFHDVYTQPEAAKVYRQTGQFGDGTVLVKEIRQIGAGKMTTGQAQWATEPAIWFVMIKDAEKRFKGPHWSKGWGWALFKAETPMVNASESFEKTCRGCHLPARGSDWVFVDGYPTLRP